MGFSWFWLEKNEKLVYPLTRPASQVENQARMSPGACKKAASILGQKG
jgi:hypothetical protein